MAGVSSSSSVEVTEETENVLLQVDDGNDSTDEDAPLIGTAECRICQDEDSLKNLESPCACNGSLKYAHRVCVQHWCNEKGDITCEICHQNYLPGYVAPPRPEPVETVIDIRGGWQVAGTPINFHDPRLLAIAEAERHQFMESDFDNYNDNDASGAAFLRSAALIFMALLLMRHAAGSTDEGGDDDSSAVFSLFLLRIIGFLLPCYIMVWVMTVLQQRRQRQEAANLAGTPFAFVVRSGQNRGIHLAIARPAPPPGAMLTPVPVPTASSMSTPRHEQV